MSGYIIPSDWDGVSYKCFSVSWPDSPEWTQILSGCLAGFYLPGVWDAATGDADAAAETGAAIIDKNTVGADFPPDCTGDDMSIIQIGTFLDEDFAVPATEEVTIPFIASYQSVAQSWNDLSNLVNITDGNAGVWIFECHAQIVATSPAFILYLNHNGVRVAQVISQNQRHAYLSFSVPVAGPQPNEFQFRVFCSTASTMQSAANVTWARVTRLGDFSPA